MAKNNLKARIKDMMITFEGNFQVNVKNDLEVPAKKLTGKHRKVVASWSHRPTFSYRITANPNQVRLTVYPKGDGRQFYLWTDKGTAPHVIRPKNGGYLRFKTGYSARTAPGGQYNVGTGIANGGWVSFKEVNHPGTAARGFSEKFNTETLPEIRQIVQNAFRRAMRQR